MARRWGWTALAAVGALFFVATAIGGAAGVGLAIADGEGAAAILGFGPAVLGLVFWRWIVLGAWYRAHPPLDPDTGEPVRDAEPIGPWGVVGRILMVLIVAGFTAIGVLALTVDRNATDRAEEVRGQAERTLRGRAVTVAQVERLQAEHERWIVAPNGPDPYATFVDIPEAELVDVSVDGDQAALLFETDDSPPCAVVTVDELGLVRSRLSSDCP